MRTCDKCGGSGGGIDAGNVCPKCEGAGMLGPTSPGGQGYVLDVKDRPGVSQVLKVLEAARAIESEITGTHLAQMPKECAKLIVSLKAAIQKLDS